MGRFPLENHYCSFVPVRVGVSQCRPGSGIHFLDEHPPGTMASSCNSIWSGCPRNLINPIIWPVGWRRKYCLKMSHTSYNLDVSLTIFYTPVYRVRFITVDCKSVHFFMGSLWAPCKPSIVSVLRSFCVVSFCDFCVRITQTMVFIYRTMSGRPLGPWYFWWYSSIICSIDAKQNLAFIFSGLGFLRTTQKLLKVTW